MTSASLGVPEYVLLKPGRLTEEEFAKIKEHPRIGADILDPVEFPWPVLLPSSTTMRKWDGTGYPEGLKGENIPLQGCHLAVADVQRAEPRRARIAARGREGDTGDSERYRHALTGLS